VIGENPGEDVDDRRVAPVDCGTQYGRLAPQSRD
jgi:hypothetical protein